MYSLEIVIVTAVICYISGLFSGVIFTKKEVTLEKRVALAILLAWISFAMIAYLQDKDLSIYFNAAGMGAVGNLLGIKTSELFNQFFNRK